jgi:RNA polymerase sigma-70 factor (ECF subfamily)
MVLGHKLIAKADAAKGRFRSLLLIALNRYLINVHNAETAHKRIPGEKLVPWDFVGSSDLPEPLIASSPEESFNYAWVSSLLDRALEEVEAKCHADGLSAHWHLFHDRVLEPILNRDVPPSLPELCEKYGVATPAAASNMIVTVKRRFQNALRRHLRDSSLSEDGTQEELLELQRYFPEIAQDRQ